MAIDASFGSFKLNFFANAVAAQFGHQPAQAAAQMTPRGPGLFWGQRGAWWRTLRQPKSRVGGSGPQGAPEP